MARRSESIVVARVERIAAGQPLRHDPKVNAPDAEPIPTERVTVSIRRLLRGTAGEQAVVFRTKFEQFQGADGDPPYQAGEFYVLFLRARHSSDDTVLPVAPDGRVALVGGRLEPLIEGAVADDLRGKSVDDLRRMLP